MSKTDVGYNWYLIILEQQNYEEVVAKVSSKGLAVHVLDKITEVYKDTEYIVTMRIEA